MEAPAHLRPLGRRVWLVLGLGALALTALLYLTPPTLFETYDFVRIHGFFKEYLVSAIRAGRLPLWNPHIGLGRPFLAEVDTGAFYPPNLLYLVLGLHAACALLVVMHVGLGLWGMLRLGRALGVEDRIAIAIAFAFFAASPVVACYQTGLVNYGNALCYLPAALFLALRVQEAPTRRALAALAALLGLQLLCGHPQMSWITVFGAALLLAGRRLGMPFGLAARAAGLDLARLLLATGGALSLAAVELVPLAELWRQSTRLRASIEFAAAYAMHPVEWATLLVPAGPWFPAAPSSLLYLGLAVVLAGLCGIARLSDPNIRALFIVALVAALIALGTATPLFELFYYALPGLATMRVAARASILVALSLALAAGVFLGSPSDRGVRSLILLWAIALGATAAAVAFLRWQLPGLPISLATPRGGLILLAASLVTLWRLRARFGLGMRLAVGGALLAFAAADSAWAAVVLKQHFREVAEWPGESYLRRELVRRGHFAASSVPPRVFVPLPPVRENAGMRYGHSGPHSYTSPQLARVWDHLHIDLGLPVPIGQSSYPDPALMKFGPLPYRSMNLVAGFDPTTRRLVDNPNPDPRAYLAYAAEPVANHREASERMRAGHDFHRVALVEENVAGLPRVPPASIRGGSARVVRFEPESILLAVESHAPALLILAETWYPGWTAAVNGRAAACLPANAWMRAVPVPAGRTEVSLRFGARPFVWGGALSAAAALALLALAAAPCRRMAARAPTTANHPGGQSGGVPA